MRPGRLFLCAALALGLALEPAQGWAAEEPEGMFQRVFGQRAGPAEQALVLPVQVGARRGDVRARVSANFRQARLRFEELRGLLVGSLRPDLLESLRAQVDEDGFVSLEALRSVGLDAEFDATSLSARIGIPTDRAALRAISLRGDARPQLLGEEVEPAAVSGFVNLRSSFDYVGRHSGTIQRGVQPTRLGAEGAINFRGWVLESDAVLLEGAAHAWQRGRTRLVRDRPGWSVRMQAGDLLYQTMGFQSALTIAGVGVGTEFTLQPYRVVEPSGSREVVLDSPSTVEVWVNGRQVRTLRLPEGRYDLRDFRLGVGLNEVVLRIEDALGRQREVRFPLAFEDELLAPGVHEFGYNLGIASETRDGVLHYYEDRWRYSLLHRYGVTDAMTLGAHVQGEEEQWLAGLDLGLTGALGSFRAEYALSRGAPAPDAYAARVQYQYFDATARNRWRRRWQLSALSRGRGFRLPDAPAPGAWSSLELAAAVSQEIPHTQVVGTLSGRWSVGRGSDPDESSVALLLRRTLWGGLQLELTLERSWTVQGTRDFTTLFSLSWKVPERQQTLRFDHDSADHTTRLAWRRSATQAIGGLGGQFQLSRNPVQRNYGGSLQYVSPRYELELVHNGTEPDTGAGFEEQRTGLRLGTSLAFAGRAAGLSRPIGESFALVVPHPRLSGHTIGIDRSGDTYQAQADRLGPAVVPHLIPYQPHTVAVDAPDLPAGLDLGQTVFQAQPTYKSGVRIRVGSRATVAVRGRLHFPDGEPVALQAGELSGLAPGAPVLPIFTNRTGRFVTEGLPPGHYQLRLRRAPRTVIGFSVPEDAFGMVEIHPLSIGIERLK